MVKALIRLIFFAVLAAPVVLAIVVVERAPIVRHPTEATPETARATRDVVRRVRQVSETPDQDQSVRVTLEEINAVISFAARLIPGLRGKAAITEPGVRFRFSLPVPLMPHLGWINGEAVVPSFASEPRLAAVRLGPLDLPPGVVTRAGVVGANLVMGESAGDRIMQSVPRLTVEQDAIVAVVKMDATERKSLTRRVASVLRGEEMPVAAEIRTYYRALRRAIDRGELPHRGSFLPYLRFAVAETLRRAEPGRQNYHFTAALFAVTKACGARAFRLVVGKLAAGIETESEPEWRRHCKKVEFAGRIDSRRHFITAAAIKAASTMKVSFAIGEFKELVDSIGGAKGFDFTDIVANASGIRFAAAFMRADRDDWPDLLARLETEADVLASYDGIPGLMPRAEFERRFCSVDSPRYAKMVARIEARIDRLALHAPLPREP